VENFNAQTIEVKPEIATAFYREAQRLADIADHPASHHNVTPWIDCEENPTHVGFYQFKMNYKSGDRIVAVLWDGEQFVRPGSHSPMVVIQGDQWRGLWRRIDDYA
jgi:hypothetical protein